VKPTAAGERPTGTCERCQDRWSATTPMLVKAADRAVDAGQALAEPELDAERLGLVGR
jgi:hypothetical protein